MYPTGGFREVRMAAVGRKRKFVVGSLTQEGRWIGRPAVADPVTGQFSTILRKTRANPLNFLLLFSTFAVTCIARGGAGTRVSAETEFSTLFAQNIISHLWGHAPDAGRVEEKGGCRDCSCWIQGRRG